MQVPRVASSVPGLEKISIGEAAQVSQEDPPPNKRGRWENLAARVCLDMLNKHLSHFSRV